MKNRRFLVVAFLLVAAMVIGVGYAAISQQLKFTGSINVLSGSAQEEFSGDIYFAQNYSVKATSKGSTMADTDAKAKNPASPNAADKALSFDLAVNTLELENDTVTYTFTIENHSSHNVHVDFSELRIREQQMADTNGTFTNDTVTVDWTYSWSASAAGDALTGFIPKATDETTPGTVTLTITIKLTQNPYQDKVASIYGLLTATAID
jgi:hypothetical protein